MSGVDILPGVEALQIVSSVDNVLRAEFPLERLRGGAVSASLTTGQWRLVADMGLVGLALSADCGGVGYTVAEEVLVHRSLARALVSTNVIATALVADWLARSREGHEPGYLDGSQYAAFAVRRGEDLYLIDGAGASCFVVLDRSGAYLIDAGSLAGAEALQPLDATLPMLRIAGREGELADNGPRAHLLLAAELSGVAQAAVDMATAYANVRKQFGKFIGSFQAIAHACADAAMRAEAANAQVLFAAIALRDKQSDANFQVAAACRLAGDAAVRNATMNIHTHGGIGYSAECDAHLYLKRALLLRQLASSLGDDAELLLGQGAVVE